MATYRQHLPQLEDRFVLTDGGIETTLIFQEGLDLPYFAAFHLLKDESGTEVLRRYYTQHAAIAQRYSVGFILKSATWRASSDWGDRLGYTPAALAEANRKAISLLHELRSVLETEKSPMIISGCVGPRGIRANASTCSHAELDEATELDDGNPVELGQQYSNLRAQFAQINVLGGCCGTDHRHIEQIARACLATD